MADIQFNLRIPEELKEKVKDAAKKSGRSINAEAHYRLEQSFDEIQKPNDASNTSKYLKELINRLEDIEQALQIKKMP